MSSRLQKSLVEDALWMAVEQHKLTHGLIHHSDQGSQYTIHNSMTLLKYHDIQMSI